MTQEVKNPAVAAAGMQLREAAQEYLGGYSGADDTRPQRINTWVRLLGDIPMTEITPEIIDEALSRLANEPAKVYSGKDADGNPIFKRKTGKRSAATINRWPWVPCLPGVKNSV